MHILHIITGLNDGGAEAVLYRLSTTDKLQCHTVVSLIDAGKYGPLLENAGVSVVCLNMPKGRLTISGLWKLWRFIRSYKPDVVQTWMYHADLIGGVLARLAGVRCVFWGIRNSTLEPGKSRRSTITIARINARLSHFIPSGIVCCAERALDVHRELGYSANKLKVIHNGYDLGRFHPDPAARLRLRAEWGLDNDIFLLGMVGRFDPQKDHENLLRALDELKRVGRTFRCVFIGRGLDSTNTQLADWLEQYNLCENVLLLGQHNNVSEVMAALDLHILSSAFGEAFPNVLAEAMACGTPCVSTNVGDAAYIIGDTGWVVPPGNSHKLASAIEQAQIAFYDQEAWHTRCEAARSSIVSRFNIEKMLSAYHAIWRCNIK